MNKLEKIKSEESFKNVREKKSIVVLDSGIGGLHILKECIKLISNYNFIYVADTVNAPYGNKSKKELIRIADKLISELNEEYNPDIFVLACNSLTVNCINFLRDKYKKEFVGIEPALKQAKLNGGDTIIFATQTTLKSYHKLNIKCTKQLKREHKEQNLRYYNKDKVYKIFIPDLPSKIDENCNDLEVLIPTLEKQFVNPVYKNVNNLVLGCTHFIAIKPQLKEILGEVQIFDGAIPVAKRLQSLLQGNANDKMKESFFDLEAENMEVEKKETDNKEIDERELIAGTVGVEVDVKSEKSETEIKSDKTETGKKQTEIKTDKKIRFSQIRFLALDGNPSKKALLKQYFTKILK